MPENRHYKLRYTTIREGAGGGEHYYRFEALSESDARIKAKKFIKEDSLRTLVPNSIELVGTSTTRSI